MCNSKVTLDIKISTLFSFFFSFIFFFSCTAYYLFIKLDDKCSQALKQAEFLNEQCSILMKSNNSMQEEILLLKSPIIRLGADNIQKVDSTFVSSGFGLSDAVTIHLINLSCILFALFSLGVISYFSYVILLKYLVSFSNSFVFKSVFGLLSYKDFSNFFLSNSNRLPSEFSYLDQFDNTVRVLFSKDQKCAEVCVKLCDSDVFLPLADILCQYQTLIMPQSPSILTSLNISIVDLVSANSASSGGAGAVSSGLDLFNSIN